MKQRRTAIGSFYRKKLLRLQWKVWPVVLLVIMNFPSLSQGRIDWRVYVDDMIREADSAALEHQRTFYLTKYFSADRPYKETWYYTVQDNEILEFEIRYYVDSVEFSETYYLDNGRPICMERYETVYYSYYEDEIKRGEVLFFINNNLKQYVTVGHRPKSYYGYNQAYGSLKRFSDRYAELKENIIATGQGRSFEPRRH